MRATPASAAARLSAAASGPSAPAGTRSGPSKLAGSSPWLRSSPARTGEVARVLGSEHQLVAAAEQLRHRALKTLCPDSITTRWSQTCSSSPSRWEETKTVMPSPPSERVRSRIYRMAAGSDSSSDVPTAAAPSCAAARRRRCPPSRCRREQELPLRDPDTGRRAGQQDVARQQRRPAARVGDQVLNADEARRPQHVAEAFDGACVEGRTRSVPRRARGSLLPDCYPTG